MIPVYQIEKDNQIIETLEKPSKTSTPIRYIDQESEEIKKQTEKTYNEFKNKIRELEYQITPRRIREALLSGDNSFIDGIEKQIADLRNLI